jgi:hypothetical protein
VDGACVACRADADCPDSRRPLCREGVCRDGCLSDTDCRGTWWFTDGRCVDNGCVECTQHGDCHNTTFMGANLCRDHRCVEGCFEDGDCFPNSSEQVCVDGQCRYCRSNADCFNFGDTCVANDCVGTCGYRCQPCCTRDTRWGDIGCYGSFTCYDGTCNSGPGMPCD